MSAFGGKADVIQDVAECPLIAISGHWDNLIPYLKKLNCNKVIAIEEKAKGESRVPPCVPFSYCLPGRVPRVG